MDPFFRLFSGRCSISKSSNGVTALVVITNYVEDDDSRGAKKAYNFQTLSLPEDLDLVNVSYEAQTVSIYGIPWVIGANTGPAEL